MQAANLFKGKYRTKTLRLEGFDYGTDGAYLVTLCSKDRVQIFSEIINAENHLSFLGRIVEDELRKTSEIRKYVTVSEWIIMPNHIHCIIFIHKNSEEPEHLSQKGSYLYFPEGYRNQFMPQSENLASIVRGIKSSVTSQAKKAGVMGPIWQARYYEHIIRNEIELRQLILYILENPFAWEENENFEKAS